MGAGGLTPIKIQIIGDSSSAQRAFKDADGSAGGFASKIGQHAARIAGALAGAFAVTKIVSFFRTAVSEARESAKVTRLTENAIRSTGGAAQVTAAHIGKLATKLSNLTGIDDEVVQSSQNLLLTFTKIQNQVGKGNDIFDQASAAVLDMSVAFGTDASSSAIQLGKALNDPIKGITALSKVGVSFTAQQKEQIKQMMKVGDIAGAQKIILGELATETGGAAAASADAVSKFGVVMSNLKESIGTAVLPVLNRLLGWAADKLPVAIEGLSAAWKRLQSAIRPVAEIVEGMAVPAFGKLADWLKLHVLPAADDVSKKFKNDLVPAIGGTSTIAGFVGAATAMAAVAVSVIAVRDAIAALTSLKAVEWLFAVDAKSVALRLAFVTLAAAIGYVVTHLDKMKPILKDVTEWYGKHNDAVNDVASAITAVLLVALVRLGIQTAITIGESLVLWSLYSAAAVASAARIAASWVVIQAAALVANIEMAVFAVLYAASWASMAAAAMAGAVRMAASWIVAMGPVAWVIAIIVGLVAVIIYNWDTVSRVTTEVFGAVGRVVVGTFNAILGFLATVGGSIVHTVSVIWAAVNQVTTTVFRAVGDFIVGTFNGIIGFFASAPGRMARAVSGMWDGLKDAFRSALNWIIDKWNAFRVPGISILGQQVSPEVNFPDIARFAKGGILRGTGIVGELGPEVITVGSDSRIFPMKQLAEAMSNAGGSSRPVSQVTNNYNIRLEGVIAEPLTEDSIVSAIAHASFLHG